MAGTGRRAVVDADAPLVVELLGQPGAGKTTLAHAAAKMSKTMGRAELGAAWRQLPAMRKGLVLWQAIRNGACLARATRLVFGEPLLRWDSIARLARLLVKSHWTRSQSRPLLLEEGALQDLWSIYYSAGKMEPDPQLLAPLVRCLYRNVNARIVLLQVEPTIAFDRIRGRLDGKSRLDPLPEAELWRRLAGTAQLPHRLADAARLAGLQVETLDVSRPVETSVSRLHAIMRGN